jgi:hypothetical protein
MSYNTEGHWESATGEAPPKGCHHIQNKFIICPICEKFHVDEFPWDQFPHRDHLCEHCGTVFCVGQEYSRGMPDCPMSIAGVKMLQKVIGGWENDFMNHIQGVALMFKGSR